MDYAKAFGIPVISHAEDANLVGKGVMNEGPLSNELGLRGNPTAAEEIMVAREISLCRLTKCPVHIAHVSSLLAVEHIRRAKEEGLPLTAEVTPHHLSLTDECIRTYDTHCKMAPPLRSEADREAVMSALSDGTIDLIATDHAPHAVNEKITEFDHAANGILGLETTVPVTLEMVHDDRMSVMRWIDSLTIAPAKLLKLEEGRLKVGLPADVTVVDPDVRWTITKEDLYSKSQNSPFVGREYRGRVTHTFVGGTLRFRAEA
jgi:dihydroorotase